MRAARFIFAMMLLSAAGIAFAAPASSVVPTWSAAPSVSPPGAPTGALVSVACATDTRCFAIGRSFGQPLIEQWDGVHWTILPAVPLTAGAQLNDIACASSTSCFAVGILGSQVLVDQWNGTSWSVAATPSIAGAPALWSVACPSAVSCFAAGRVGGQVLIEQWDGSNWSVASSPTTSGHFTGVACSSPSDCSAVGSSDGISPLIEHWDGSGWSFVASPAPGYPTVRNLNSIACASSTACFAVGSSGAKPLIERWNGSTWTDVSGVTGAVTFADVSCPSATVCFVVGDVGHPAGNGPGRNVVERWNGTKWSVVASPNADASSDGLSAIGCWSSVSCLALGTSGNPAAPATIERWNGTSWVVVKHPMPLPSDSSLSAVSCAVPAPCFAVGQHATKTGTVQTLIERRMPSGWVVSPSPNAAGSMENALAAVSCRSLSFCIAVGSSSTSTAVKTLIERWNGSKWAIVPSPNHGTDRSVLAGVSCTSAKVCFAVGSFTRGANTRSGWSQTLVERWNGTRWAIVPSPNRPNSPRAASYNRLEGVSCTSAANCVAVGEDVSNALDPFAKTLTLVERWNGSKWSILASPNPGPYLNWLVGVSCPSAASCFAVGGFETHTADATLGSSLIAHWNGKVWTRLMSADRASARYTSLAGVSCPSTTSCFAVGMDLTGSTRSMIAKTRTSGWSTAALGPPVGILHGISCTSSSRCFAVGDVKATGAIKNTLVEQYS